MLGGTRSCAPDPRYRDPMPSRDTTADAARIQRTVLASKTCGERAAIAFEMSELVFGLTVEGIRRRHPDLDEPALTLALIERLHGPALARAVADAGVAARGG